MSMNPPYEGLEGPYKPVNYSFKAGPGVVSDELPPAYLKNFEKTSTSPIDYLKNLEGNSVSPYNSPSPDHLPKFPDKEDAKYVHLTNLLKDIYLVLKDIQSNLQADMSCSGH